MTKPLLVEPPHAESNWRCRTSVVRERVVYVAKLILCEVLYVTGILWLVRCLFYRRRAVVLTYHRVLPEALRGKSWSHPGMIVSDIAFDMQLLTLKRWFHPVSPNDFATMLVDGRSLPTYACVVTFDDGWIDTRAVAWPLLQQHGVPAIVFLPTALIGSGASFWQEDLGAALAMVAARAGRDGKFADRARVTLSEIGLAVPWVGHRGVDARTVITAVSKIKAAGQDAATRALTLTQSLLDAVPGHEIDRLMNWSEVAQMAAAGMEFGGHGANHVVLTSVGLDLMSQDVNECARRMREQFGKLARLFAYPNGNWSDAVADVVRAAGFNVAFTTQRGHVMIGDMPMQLRRVNVHEDICRRKSMFLSRLMGLI